MRTLLFVPALFLAALAGIRSLRTPAAAPAPAPAFEAGTFEVDPSHSFILFAVEHLGVSYAYGRFGEFEGLFVQDETPAKSSVKITIQAKSIDTGQEGRDRHLKSPDFFNVEQFPEITFESTKVTRKRDGHLTVEGQLGLHGVKKPVTLELDHVGEGERGERFGYRSGYRGNFRLKRGDFGMTYMTDNGMLGDEVEVTISVEGARK